MHGLTNDEMKMVMKVTNIYKHEKQILVLNKNSWMRDLR